MSYTIYASKVNEYDANTNDTWANTRAASKVDTSVNPLSPRHIVSFNGVGWRFIRTYLEFDLSSVVDPITSMTLFVKGTVVTGDITYMAYGGQTALTDSTGEYSLYLDNISGVDYLATGPITLNYTSFPLDLTSYPPSDPAGYYIIGLIARTDFINDVDSGFNQVRINNSDSIPYLVINQTGYPYEVSGVLGANITEVSGVPGANITDIIGV